jgi:Zn-dependent alcohol dehydrogenase
VIPGVVVTRKRLGGGDAAAGDQPFERGEPVVIVGLAGVGIACLLGALDLVG